MVTEFRPRSGTADRPGRRADVTGLRALAVVPLLLAAAGVTGPGGLVGIDVFFVLTGFLVTSALYAQWRHAGRISLTRFYARSVRRLFPAGALVLAVSLPITLLCLPRDRWTETGWDLLASGLSVLNWRLAERGGVAVTPDAATSLLGHYWALGVAAQFLLLWPLLLFGLAALVRGGDNRTWLPGTAWLRGVGPGTLGLAAAGLLAVGSFAWSVVRAGSDPERAFLGTGTRLWELALGAVVALLGTRLARLPRRFGTILGWTGAGAVVGAVLTLRPGPEFPGYLALLPALGAAAIIAAGAGGRIPAPAAPATGDGAAESPDRDSAPAMPSDRDSAPATPPDRDGTAELPDRDGAAGLAERDGAGSRSTVGSGSAGVGGTRGAGTGTGRPGPTGILASRPVRVVGELAYPLYLWHWPLLVAAHARFGDPHPVAALAVLGCAVGLAVLTRRYVEEPSRVRLAHWSPGQMVRVGALLPAAGIVVGLLFQLAAWPPARTAAPHAAAPAAGPTVEPTAPVRPTAPGAAALGRSPGDSRAGVPVNRVRSITPAPADAASDLPDVYRHNCFPTDASGTARACVYGHRESRFTVALAGDSHAASWVPALQAIATAQRWRLVTYLKPNCPFADINVAMANGRTVTACTEWYDNVLTELTGPERPKLLLTTSARFPPGRDGRSLTGAEAHRELVRGMQRTWASLAAARVPTVVLRDVPFLASDSADCVSANPRRLTRCTTARRTALATSAGAAQQESVRKRAGVRLIDLNSAICPAQRCAPVIGGVLVYRDREHLTATYARTLAPRLRGALDRVIESAP